ncbi:MAG: DNA-binding transcriptional LysR family regulator [Colwellia sp.]
MDIRFLKSLIAVVETGSIASAGRLQNLTATAISQRIRSLENELGSSLLSRSAHSATPTEACLNILPRIKKIIRESEALKADIDTTGLSANLRLGSIDTALTDFIPTIVKELKTVAPKSTISIIPGSSSALYEQLLLQNLDGAITVMPTFIPPKEIKVTSLVKQNLVLLSKTPQNRPLKTVLENQPLIVYDRGSWGGNSIQRWINSLNISPQILCELDSPETIALLVENGLGVAVVPEWEGLRKRHTLLSITTIDKHAPLREIVFLSHQKSNAPKLLELSINLLSS